VTKASEDKMVHMVLEEIGEEWDFLDFRATMLYRDELVFLDREVHPEKMDATVHREILVCLECPDL